VIQIKKAVIIMAYKDEEVLDSFLSTANTDIKVMAIYKNLDAADVEHLEDVINRDLVD
jgi:hypothetical protein